MPVKDQYVAWVLEQLAGVSGLRSRCMFGGVGLYSGERFFGLIDDDVLYLKVDDSNRAEFVARGCNPFQPFKDKPEYSMSYYDVPPDVLEDVEELARWARRSVGVASVETSRRKPRPASDSRPARAIHGKTARAESGPGKSTRARSTRGMTARRRPRR